jgi:hypothetical protein
MSLSTEQYNRLRGPALTVLIMDKVRHYHTTGHQVTTRQLALQLAREAQLDHRTQFGALYSRVRIQVRTLADAGLITTTTSYHPKSRVNLTTITLSLCSASTAK